MAAGHLQSDPPLLLGRQQEGGQPQAAQALGLREPAAFLVIYQEDVRARVQGQTNGLGFTGVRLGQAPPQSRRVRDFAEFTTSGHRSVVAPQFTMDRSGNEDAAKKARQQIHPAHLQQGGNGGGIATALTQ